MAESTLVVAKTRAALVAYLTAANIGTDNIYDEKRSGDKATPNVSCGASEAEEDDDLPGTGNFWVTAEVRVKHIAAVDADGVDPKPTSEALAKAVLNALEVSDLAEQLSAATPDYAVQGLGAGEISSEIDENCWVDVWRRRLYCCASSL